MKPPKKINTKKKRSSGLFLSFTGWTGIHQLIHTVKANYLYNTETYIYLYISNNTTNIFFIR